MAYIGKTPVLGNFVKLDAISVVNGQAAYTMQNSGVNFTSYDNVNQFLVSLNGILQSPTDSFTVSGSTLTFVSNLSTGDVIDFVMVLGNTLDIGTPSDNTVSLAKLTATGTKDATTFLRGDNTFASPSSDFVKISETDLSSGNSSLSLDWSSVSSIYDNYEIRISYQGTSSNALGLRGIFGGSPSSSTIYTIGTRYWVINTSNGTGGGNVGDYNTYNQAYIGYSASATASVPQAFNIRIFNPNDTTGHKILQLFNSYRVDNTPVEYRTEVGTLFIRNNTALDGVLLIFNGTGGANSGKISLWGLK